MKIPKPVRPLYYGDGTIKKVTTWAYTPKRFKRIFPNQFFPVLGLFADKSTQIILYLLANVDSNNMIYCTYRMIMQGCGITDRKTISKTLSELKKCDAIKEVTTSHYMLNPAVMVQGNDKKFGLLAGQFNSLAGEKQETQTQKTKKTQEEQNYDRMD